MRRVPFVIWLLLLSSCTSGLPPTLPDPNSDVGLGEVELLVWTTRAPNGLLGHARERERAKVDVNRCVARGTPRFTPTDQHLVMVRAQQLQATAEGGMPTLNAHASLSRATHVAYDVRVTGYLELFPDETKYVPSSSCCQAGMVSETCGASYVTRLIRGSGTVQHLQRLDASAGVEAAELVRARGGTSYRRLNETSFVDAYFAYQLEPLASLCSTLSPDDEMETLAVQAPNNCWVQAHLEDGTRHSRAFRSPDSAVCRKLAEHHCKAQVHMAACTASFGADGQAAPLALFEANPSPPATAPAAITAPSATPAVVPAPRPANAP
jgi:hypothetical protein